LDGDRKRGGQSRKEEERVLEERIEKEEGGTSEEVEEGVGS